MAEFNDIQFLGTVVDNDIMTIVAEAWMERNGSTYNANLHYRWRMTKGENVRFLNNSGSVTYTYDGAYTDTTGTDSLFDFTTDYTNIDIATNGDLIVAECVFYNVFAYDYNGNPYDNYADNLIFKIKTTVGSIYYLYDSDTWAIANMNEDESESGKVFTSNFTAPSFMDLSTCNKLSLTYPEISYRVTDFLTLTSTRRQTDYLTTYQELELTLIDGLGDEHSIGLDIGDFAVMEGETENLVLELPLAWSNLYMGGSKGIRATLNFKLHTYTAAITGEDSDADNYLGYSELEMYVYDNSNIKMGVNSIEDSYTHTNITNKFVKNYNSVTVNIEADFFETTTFEENAQGTGLDSYVEWSLKDLVLHYNLVETLDMNGLVYEGGNFGITIPEPLTSPNLMVEFVYTKSYANLGTTENETAYLRFSVDLIDYYDPVVILDTTQADGEGNVTVEFSGYYWPGIFSSGSNNITISYTLTDKGTTELVAGTDYYVSSESGSFSGSLSFTGLDYQKEYILEMTVVDTISTVTQTLRFYGTPIFYWNDEEFIFNVPVNATQGISGDVSMTLDDANSIGKNSYDEETNTTYIYGNEIALLSNHTVTVNGFNLIGALNAMTTTYPLTVDVSPYLTDYGSVSCRATLYGNCLYLRVSGTRDSASSSATIASVIIYHEGKIADCEDIVTSASTSGNTASLRINRQSFTDRYLEYNIVLANAAASTNVVFGTFIIPVVIDTAAYV